MDVPSTNLRRPANVTTFAIFTTPAVSITMTRANPPPKPRPQIVVRHLVAASICHHNPANVTPNAMTLATVALTTCISVYKTLA